MGLVYIVWGRRLFGRVERVPGFFCVATEFFHLWYCPLIPKRSVVVLAEDGKRWKGIPIPFSMKSILLAWSMAASLLVWIFGGLIGIVVCTDRHTDLSDKILFGGVPLAAFIAWLLLLILPRYARPQHARVMELAKAIHLHPSKMAELDAQYRGRPEPQLTR